MPVGSRLHPGLLLLLRGHIFKILYFFFIILSLQKNTKNYYKNIQGLVKVRNLEAPPQDQLKQFPPSSFTI